MIKLEQSILRSPLPSSYHNLEGRGILCNDLNAELLDLKDRHDICNKKAHDLVEDKNFALRVEETLFTVIKNQISKVSLYTFKTNQSNLVSWLNVMKPDFDENNQVCGVHGFAIPLAKNNQCFINHCLSENGVPTYALSLIVPDSEFKHPYLENLTKQEQKVLSFFLRGYSCKRISQKLFLSPRTIETHICHIKNKFSVNNSDDLIDLCYESGLAVALNFM